MTESSDFTIGGIVAVIVSIESQTARAEEFIPDRYPYTYGWDYMRAHYLDFGWGGGRPSRAQVAHWAQESYGEQDAAHVAMILADAYLREHGVIRDRDNLVYASDLRRRILLAGGPDD